MALMVPLNLSPLSCMVFLVSNSIDVGGETGYGMVSAREVDML